MKRHGAGIRLLIAVPMTIFLAACEKQQVAPIAASADEAIAANYVLAACLMQRYSGTPIAEEADIWAQGLVESGNLPADAYPALAGLISRAPEPVQAQNGMVMRMQNCMALRDSPQTAAEIRKLVSR